MIYYYDHETESVNIVTGYKNIVAVDNSLFKIQAMYAVATNVGYDAATKPYWVADAIVIETKFPVINVDNGLILGYNHVATNVKDFGDLEVVLADGSLSELNVAELDGMTAYQYNAAGYGEIKAPAFYAHTTIDETDSYLETIDENYAKYGVYVTRIDRKVDLQDYVTTIGYGTSSKILDIAEDTIVYDFIGKAKYNALTTEDSEGDALEFEVGEYYIVVADGDDVIYAIRVDQSWVDDYYKPVQDLFNDIYFEAIAP